MNEANENITAYIEKATPEFKEVMIALRSILNHPKFEIKEDWKWNAPNFNNNGMICWLAFFKNHVGMNFFKGSLIKDKYNLFTHCGEEKGNRQLKFSDINQIIPEQIEYYISQAVKLNQENIKIEKKVINTSLPLDLETELNNNPKANVFFESLAPSYKRDYIQWITDAKREATRNKRLATTIEWLSEGKKKNWKYENC